MSFCLSSLNVQDLCILAEKNCPHFNISTSDFQWKVLNVQNSSFTDWKLFAYRFHVEIGNKNCKLQFKTW